jgi:hypothetical protein
MPVPSNFSPARLARAALDWLCNGRPDYRAFRERRGTHGYQKRRGWCVWLWIAAGLLMIAFPGIEIIFMVSLGTTLVCFMLLDAMG